ncbi:hypothetical protein EGW08_000751 [Elysia chlorotica]|uniref:Uncharacterized protein n=1 Tax=Elysia chlorotica TaxID=188477 RepID=A0A3S1A5V1_ELYCH|nr:hypothetical protein EGW08_000751 [Elysia chlorotica]
MMLMACQFQQNQQQHFNPAQNHNFFPQTSFPRQPRYQHYGNGLLPAPSHQHQPQRFPKRAGAGPRPQRFSPPPRQLSAGPGSDSSPCYQFEEIKLARRALGIYFEQVPVSLRRWQPLQQDSLGNQWEGEGGMMDHCSRPFPLPATGQVTAEASVYRPLDEGQDTGEARLGKTSSEGDNSRTEVVSVSDDDSDVQVMSTFTPSDPSKPIVIEASPVTSRPKKKRKKKILGT